MDNKHGEIYELIDIVSYRRDRFGLIASVFESESSEETISHMILQAKIYCRELDESIELDLNRGLTKLDCDNFSTFATKTRTEYARLFLGPREVVAPLHESAYLSGTSRMFTAQTMAVRAFYEHYGYEMKTKNREPEDGIGVEFEFLRNLCGSCISLLEHYDTSLSSEDTKALLNQVENLLEAQETFEGQHLNRWAHRFSQRVIENDRSGFYAVWANYLNGVLDEDNGLLSECSAILKVITENVSEGDKASNFIEDKEQL